MDMSLEANAAELTRLILRDVSQNKAPLFDDSHVVYFDAALACARAIDDARIRAIGVCALGARATTYSSNTFETMFYDDEMVAEIERLITAYAAPTLLLNLAETHTDNDNETSRKIACCRVAMQIDPTCYLAYLSLAATILWSEMSCVLPPEPEVRIVNASELLIHTIHINPNVGAAYTLLSFLIGENRAATVLLASPTGNMVAYTAHELLLLAIDRAPTSAHGYVELAISMVCPMWPHTVVSPHVQLLDGRTLSIVELCFEALRQDARCGDAYGCIIAMVYIRPDLYMLVSATCDCSDAVGEHVCLPDKARATMGHVGMLALRYGSTTPSAYRSD